MIRAQSVMTLIPVHFMNYQRTERHNDYDEKIEKGLKIGSGKVDRQRQVQGCL